MWGGWGWGIDREREREQNVAGGWKSIPGEEEGARAKCGGRVEINSRGKGRESKKIWGMVEVNSTRGERERGDQNQPTVRA